MRRRGTVQEYYTSASFGLIQVDGSIRRILVRQEVVEAAGYSTLDKGERLEFDLAYDERFIPYAKRIRRIESGKVDQRQQRIDVLPISA